CQMNDLDSQKMGLILSQMGYVMTDDPKLADLILFNTCTIREKPYHKAMSEIGRATKIKRRMTNKIIGVCGCVAQQDGEALLRKFPEIDFVCGPDQISTLQNLVEGALKGKRISSDKLISDANEYKFIELVTSDPISSCTAFVKVIKGCNYQCSYCIVPSVRGSEISRDPSSVVDEVSKLIALGVKEITLLGQNVTAYSIGTKRRALPELIQRISNETTIERIRFVAPHPSDVTDELIDEFGKNKKLCPHMHLPVQSGSNRTLKSMRRGYTIERFYEIINKLRDISPDIAITTDIIAGFSGESDEDYNETYALIENVRFDSIFAFKYSPRPGTRAMTMPDDVDYDKKVMRLDKLLKLQQGICLEKNNKLIGSEIDVLVTGLDRMATGQLMGRSPDNRLVNFSGESSLIGSIVRVTITKGMINSLQGRLE
ncbi:MAG: tRNA (N6-isopentenyl adenosine(37)-C2)-methylthiotransferase MiaB, partial [Pseudomonadota bacterium]